MTANNILVNDVPMQGKGFYSSHSELQHAAMLEALPLLRRATAEITVDPSQLGYLTVAEYGSAHGNNSFEPCSAIIQSSPLPKDSQVSLIFSDRPENDFVALSSNIAAFEASHTNEGLFTAMVPKSFYQQIAPSASVSIGFSLACLHHLEHVPPLAEGESPVDESRISALRQQSHSALERFVNHRAAEIVPGGALVLSFVAQASTGEENYAGLVDACRRALVEMLQAGLIPMAAATAFEVPTYNRTLQDLEDLKKNGVPGKWIVKEIFEKRVVHPAGAELRARHQKNNRGPQRELDSEWYAKTVTDWLMAVVSGYFLKALRVGLASEYTEQQGQALLAEWVQRTKDQFLAHHKDEDVNCWFIYIHLKRL
ncbi:hypothetical protein Trisim1_005931 [Trichoderma cf. simile WF8]|uniref:SAM dependent carboxyl methyltransferase n=1 Tax=Trichoderma guizhouense TaxID=1491466 RepID=A0A1T3C548_9HYPO|nr:hypothetical protein A0O28_0109980 [Trichoderma guizhouense]